MKPYKKLLGTSVFTAITASLCCMTPLLALIAGTTGAVSMFEWLEPFRPYLITITVIVIAFAWFEKFKPKPADLKCLPENNAPKFVNSKRFLGIVTLFVLLMLAFPYYSEIFFPSRSDSSASLSVINQDVKEVTYSINGMTCPGCEIHIENEVSQLPGIYYVKADYGFSNATIKYNPEKVETSEIEKAIKKTGYIITEPSLQKWSN
jgi:mercuric ion transport protein